MARHSASPTTRSEPLPFDLNQFFSLFSLNSDVSLYLASLDLDALLSNMEIAFLRPYLPPIEISRARAAVLSDILAIERTFSIMEHAGLDVAELRSCLTSARTVIIASIARADRETLSPPSSPSSASRPISPPPRLHASGAGGPPPTGPHHNYDPAQPRHTLASESSAHHAPYYRPAAAPALRAYEPSHLTQHASPYKSTVTTTNSKLSFKSEWYPPMRS